jgi:hypothetical protein
MGNYSNTQRLNYLRQSFTNNTDRYNQTNFKFNHKVPFAVSFDEIEFVDTLEQVNLFTECLKDFFDKASVELSIIKNDNGTKSIDGVCDKDSLFWQLDGRAHFSASGDLDVPRFDAGDLIYLKKDSVYTINTGIQMAIAVFKI